MAIKRTSTWYQLMWYDADGRFRKRTYRGISRQEGRSASNSTSTPTPTEGTTR